MINDTQKFPSCPQCSQPLSDIRLQGLRVLQCPQCKGFLIKQNDLQSPHLLEFADINAPASQASKIFCPRDHAPMMAENTPSFPGFPIHRCPVCHTFWLHPRNIANSLLNKKHSEERQRWLRIAAIFLSILLAVFFISQHIIAWLLGHWDADTLKAVAMGTVLLGLFSLVGLSMACGDTASSGCASGCCPARAGFAILITSMGLRFWAISASFFIACSIFCLMAWVKHPDKMLSPAENYMKKKIQQIEATPS